MLEGNNNLKKFLNQHLPNLKIIVLWGEALTTTENCATLTHPSLAHVRVYDFDSFLRLGNDSDNASMNSSTLLEGRRTDPGNCASIIYTSGTTGMPKACMLSNDNITWTSAALNEGGAVMRSSTYEVSFIPSFVGHTHTIHIHCYLSGYMKRNHTDRVVSYLPLSHVAANIIDIHSMMAIGGCTYFAPNDVLSGQGKITKILKAVRPTFFFGTPRVFEKIKDAMLTREEVTSGLQKQLLKW